MKDSELHGSMTQIYCDLGSLNFHFLYFSYGIIGYH